MSDLNDGLQSAESEEFSPEAEEQGSVSRVENLSPAPSHILSEKVRLDMARDGFTWLDNLPFSFRSTELVQRVWSRWYGSRKAADKVESLLRSSKGSAQAKYLKKSRHAEPLMLLEAVIWGRSGMDLLKAGLNQEAQASVNPMQRLTDIADELFTKYKISFPESLLSSNGEHPTLKQQANAVEGAWSFMAEIHDAGGFSSELSAKLILIDGFCRVLESEAVSETDIALAQLGVFLTLGGTLPRIECLAAITRPSVAKCFQGELKFAGVTAATFDHSRSIWTQVDREHFDETFDQVVLFDQSRFEVDGELNPFNVAFTKLAGDIVRANQLGRCVESVFQELCKGKYGYKFYSRLRKSIFDYNLAPANSCPLSDEDFPPDLLGRQLGLSDIASPESALFAVKILSEDISREAIRLEAIMTADTARAERIRGIQEQLKTLMVENSLASMKLLAELAGEGSSLVETGRNWVLEQFTPAVRDYVACWKNFYATIDALPHIGSTQHAAAQPEEPVAESFPKTEELKPDQSHVIAELQDELHTAHADNEHLRRERDELRATAHKLRSQLDRNPASQAEYIPVDCMGAISRLVARDGYGPIDVLDYFAGISPDRLAVLPEAVSGARQYPVPYEQTERMLELVGKLIGPYLDSLRNGQPDAVARTVFGGKTYAAKESETTLATARLRALREFDFKGEKRLFVQHLRVSNDTGARGMRIYFGVDGEGQDKRIVIAYVGPHLDVASSN